MKRPHISTDIDFEVKSPTAKIFLFLFPLLVILFFIVYPLFVFIGNDSDVKTQTAVRKTIYKSIDTTAFAVRHEEYVNNTYSGTVVPAVPNGRKVSIGDTVAEVFGSDSSAQAAAELKELQNEIAYYKNIDENSALMSARTLQSDIELRKNRVFDSLSSLSSAIRGNHLSEISVLARDFRDAVTAKQITMGEKTDVSEKLKRLENEYDALKSRAMPSADITAEKTGYYVNFSDGYENCLDYSDIRSVDCEKVKQALSSNPEPVPAGNMGKLITDFNWYLVCCASSDEISEIDEGDTVSVVFTDSAVGQLNMKVVKINNRDNHSQSALVLGSNEMNEDIAALRISHIQIRTKEISGFAVDKQAVRTLDGSTGVYIKLGRVVKFRKIDIVYSDDNIVLADSPQMEQGYLRLYDEIITEGTELYDGKIVD